MFLPGPLEDVHLRTVGFYQGSAVDYSEPYLPDLKGSGYGSASTEPRGGQA